jgi:hypothetical protein
MVRGCRSMRYEITSLYRLELIQIVCKHVDHVKALGPSPATWSDVIWALLASHFG